MNNSKSHGNLSKVDSVQINCMDIDPNIFLNMNSYPTKEIYDDENNKNNGNNNIKNFEVYKEMYEESINNPEKFWGNLARNNLIWNKLFTKVFLGNFKKGNINWFVNGKINACENCVDRWVEKDPNKIALIWEQDCPDQYKKITYQKLLEKTCKIANLLKLFGVKKQDTVTIYLPMIPELVYSMLACVRIGAIHNVVFAGYSATSLSDRIIDSRSTVLITSDFGLRGGKLTKLKQIADVAMDICGIIQTCIVFKNKSKMKDKNILIKTPMENPIYNFTSFDSNSPQNFTRNSSNDFNQKNSTLSQHNHDKSDITLQNEHNNYTNNCNISYTNNMYYNDNNLNHINTNKNNDYYNNNLNDNINDQSPRYLDTMNHNDNNDNNNNNNNNNNDNIHNEELCYFNQQYNTYNKNDNSDDNNKYKAKTTLHKKITKSNPVNHKISYSEINYSKDLLNTELINNDNEFCDLKTKKKSININNIINCNQNEYYSNKLYFPEPDKNTSSNFDETICVLKKGRDVDGTALMKNMRSYCPIEYVDSEDFIFLLYTSGSTGKPKGVAHTTAGYLLYAYTTCKYIFDVTENDIFGCVADIGWVTGHTYVLYGPLLNGITTVIFSSIPTYPDCGRYWNLIETHKITQFYTAPTALRALMKHGDQWIEKYDLSSCRILGSVGEPINPETWRWYYNVVGKKKCSIVDTYWQTETGGIVIAPIPNLFSMKPGSASLPFLGVQLEILDSKTLQPLSGNNVCGLLCIKSPWPGILRTVYGNHQRLIKTYFTMCPNYYFTGDGAYRDEDGYYWISGRIDDTLNVAGHRLGAAEIEHALVQHFYIAEAAVVSFHHNVKGEGILCFVVKKKGDLKNYGKSNTDIANNDNINRNELHNNSSFLICPNNINDIEEFKKNFTDEKLIEQLKLYVRQVIGPIATPDLICVVPDLPKTRSGKIIRRILRCIANGITDFGDISTVSNYEVIETINNTFLECKKKLKHTEIKK
ncbi:acetyl-CoA synthetase, putative [Plasmodium gaboni]|uniref:acetate--CoA ligase n=1 Tax=Plasmodium gaboni TaxID=647221 RepID=A0ABY1UJX1_9APIC|nr:acetyl-CoA synthetase, putative [Plasmodium gaboni]